MNIKERIEKAIKTKADNDEEDRRIQAEKDRLYEEMLEREAPDLVEKIMQNIEYMILEENLDDFIIWEAKNREGFNKYVEKMLVDGGLKVVQIEDRQSNQMTRFARWRISWDHWT